VTTTTSDVVELVTGPVQTLAADRARGELALFAAARSAGADSSSVTALRSVFPTAALEAQWTAWVDAAAAMTAARQPEWVAVCAAVAAVSGASAISAAGANDAVDAVAVGYAVADRLAGDLAEAAAAGWSVAAVAGRVGAGAAAARALRLSAGQARNAIGLCATQAAGLTNVPNAYGDLQIGKAAADAVEAVLLSRSGFTSSERSLEGRRGLFALLGASVNAGAV
jgi:hypothetical protein